MLYWNIYYIIYLYYIVTWFFRNRKDNSSEVNHLFTADVLSLSTNTEFLTCQPFICLSSHQSVGDVKIACTAAQLQPLPLNVIWTPAFLMTESLSYTAIRWLCTMNVQLCNICTHPTYFYGWTIVYCNNTWHIATLQLCNAYVASHSTLRTTELQYRDVMKINASTASLSLPRCNPFVTVHGGLIM